MRKTLLFLFVLTAVSAAAGVRTDLREGGELYEEGKYGQALSKYIEAVEKEPGNEKAVFNAGNAYYQLKDYQNAEKAYEDVIGKEGKFSQDAQFNLGNAYYRAGDKAKAVKAYEKAILMNLKDKEAVHNLQIVLQQENSQNNQNQNQNNQSDNSQNQDKQDNRDGKGQAPQNEDQNQPQPDREDMQKEDASRVMQMAKENEHKKPVSSGQSPMGANVEKDW